MSDLKRIQVGDFNIENSIKIEEVKSGNIKNFISIEEFFKQNDKIILNSNKITHFINGVKLSTKRQDGLYRIYNTNNDFIGIGIVKEENLKRDIVV